MPEIKPHIRWLIRRDMPGVLEVEKASYDCCWDEEDFLCALRQRNCIGMVCEVDHQVAGFMIYELHKKKLRILNFAVRPDFRRKGLGTAMVSRMLDKLSQQRRQTIVLAIRS